ncbi:NFX1-type zinc finger-containing protein 1 [Desmophyllum pertusum]|uniref:NFX1-type zinc finger-containing protein 1 n=1 Tax=Desmophyllum pertusum TaxID=174260 RepID=A0A9X0CYB8_9CNID|nr:NFX1-type zinc finger-containing protein 1 [Desmophyllum pertusum]
MQSTSKRHCSEDNDSKTTKRFRASDERSDGDSRGRTAEGRGGASRQERIPRPLCYKALEEICNSTSPEEGILDLANKSKRFEALLNSKTEIRADLMKLVIRAIHLCCSPNDVKRHAERMLHDMIKTNFLRLHLSSFISQMAYNSELKDTFQPSDMILRLAEIFLELLQRFGRDIVDSIPLAQLSETLGELKGKSLLHADTDMLDKKVLQVREYRDEVIRRKIESARKQEDQSTLTPPENYREISVIPQAADLNIHHKPFLRVNVVDGSYKDQEHYLDVQFRLLREDFILPLREGIRQLQKDRGALGASAANHSNHAQDVQVYRDVTVLYPVCSGKGMVYRIRFDAFDRRLRHVNWDKCKLLKFGSLLCLSTDDFYTPLFATIENRNPRELCLGELEVRFEDIELEILNRIIEEKEKFDMVESPAFFVAYRHVLEGLKEIEPDGLPFQEYIVKCNRDVGPPYYEKKMNGFFDMSGIIEDEVDEQQHGLSNSGSSNSMEVNDNDRGDGGGTAAAADSMEVK